MWTSVAQRTVRARYWLSWRYVLGSADSTEGERRCALGRWCEFCERGAASARARLGASRGRRGRTRFFKALLSECAECDRRSAGDSSSSEGIGASAMSGIWPYESLTAATVDRLCCGRERTSSGEHVEEEKETGGGRADHVLQARERAGDDDGHDRARRERDHAVVPEAHAVLALHSTSGGVSLGPGRATTRASEHESVREGDGPGKRGRRAR